MKFLCHIIALAFAFTAHAQGPTEARPLLIVDWPDEASHFNTPALHQADTHAFHPLFHPRWRGRTPAF
jgi:hypothetical protein